MQPPQTNAKAPVNSKSQNLQHWRATSSIRKSPVCDSTPWPEAGKMSSNLFEQRKDWPIPLTNNIMTTMIPKLPLKIEPQEQNQPAPTATAQKLE